MTRQNLMYVIMIFQVSPNKKIALNITDVKFQKNIALVYN